MAGLGGVDPQRTEVRLSMTMADRERLAAASDRLGLRPFQLIALQLAYALEEADGVTDGPAGRELAVLFDRLDRLERVDAVRRSLPRAQGDSRHA